MGAEFCFNIYDGKRALMVAAASSSEKSQWMEDIGETVQVIKSNHPNLKIHGETIVTLIGFTQVSPKTC